ncbi:MAG: ribose-phosphate pyrophosphokinase [Pseudomonadota bacterium]|nr:ribose-phosphate pyrophosphokinase [Pseudomonadota bacterium]QKK04272.1 MAG: ribose-phosphate pyrophosphokinase [Pseudomonadota bacterium]
MSLLFAYPKNEEHAVALVKETGYELGAVKIHHFPDGETLVRLETDVKDKDVILFCSLDHPDSKAMTLMFIAQTAKELGAKSVGLIAPYLGYMRQDKRFNEGEAITSNIFAAFLSRHFDSLITVDPHLHRHKTMKEIYTIPAQVIHAADAIAGWIKGNVEKPVLIGPDEESEQWVSDVAARADVPYTVLTKTRRGDKEVEVSVPDVDQYKAHTPVLVDDIISTAHTMIATVIHLKRAGMNPPVCIGVHAVFSGGGYEALQKAGTAKIVTCNTIPHPSNAIDLSSLLAVHLQNKKV